MRAPALPNSAAALLARFWGRGAVVVALNLAITGMVMAVGLAPASFLREAAFSNAIGIPIWLAVELAARAPLGRWRPLGYGLAIALGAVVGVVLAAILVRDVPPAAVASHPAVAQALPIALVFGVVISALILWGMRAGEAELALARRDRRLAEAEQARLRAQLDLVQAQMAPHFLLNALATVSSLIEAEPARARQLVDRLAALLRRALAHSREDRVALGEELDLLADYLQVMQARLGERLGYRVDVPEGVRARRLPPLLVQPLVENAVKHGIEPRPAGGTVTVSATDDGGRLTLRVAEAPAGDDAAPEAAPAGAGIGQANLRARLQALYGKRAELRLEEAGAGTRAVLSLPREPA